TPRRSPPALMVPGHSAWFRSDGALRHPSPPSPLPQGERGAQEPRRPGQASFFTQMSPHEPPSPLEGLRGGGAATHRSSGAMGAEEGLGVRGALFSLLLSLLLCSPALAQSPTAEPIDISSRAITRFAGTGIGETVGGLVFRG